MRAHAHRCGTLLHQAEWLLDRRQLHDAVEAFNRAEASGCDPDRCSGGRWMAEMLLGNFEAGWRESDRIRKRGLPDPNRFWQGEDIHGKRVIVRCLHGLGDAVQYLRYAPFLQTQASRLVFEVPPSLLELARHFDGVTEAITWGELAPTHSPEWDVQIEIVETPYLFRTQITELPVATNYLHPPAVVRELAIPNDSGSLCVGLVWASGEWAPSRSVPFELVRRILDIQGCEFWNLQGGDLRFQWPTSKGTHLHSAEYCANNVLRLAALISQLDLVITPDTLAAHLAGALGTPTWVMLEAEADWRWMIHRTDSPWYPNMRLFRQSVQGEWRPVITLIEAALNERLAAVSENRMVA